MATVLNIKPFQKRLFFSIGGIFLLYAVCFGVYQHSREKAYKTDILHSRLQMFNYGLYQQAGAQGIVSDSVVAHYIRLNDIEGLRVTVIDTCGLVIVDCGSDTSAARSNHLERREVKDAVAFGSGYDIKRTSESTRETYFYSATRFDGVVVRSAVPYSAALTQSLRPDSSYIFFATAVTLLLSVVLYCITRHISRRSEEDKLRIKRQLTQNAAHELKTPAASINGYLESIIDNPDMPDEKRRHFLERCYAQSGRMCKLLKDMAQLSHLDEIPSLPPRKKSSKRFCDIVPIVRAVIDDTAPQLLQKGIVSEVNLPDKIVIESPLDNPEDVFYGVFRNLVDNAVAYAAGASYLKICYEGGVFTVADNGAGVPDEHLPYIFERFYRVDKGRSRKLGGTGLGLAIVKNAVTVHSGTISAHQTPGGGLTVSFGF